MSDQLRIFYAVAVKKIPEPVSHDVVTPVTNAAQSEKKESMENYSQLMREFDHEQLFSYQQL